MLTFSRKSGQRVVIQVPGHAPLTITFLGSRPGRCQLTFDGPHDYHILREEVLRRDAEAVRCAMPETRCRRVASAAMSLPSLPSVTGPER